VYGYAVGAAMVQ